MNSTVKKFCQRIGCHFQASCRARQLVTSATNRVLDQNVAQQDVTHKKSDLYKDLHYRIKLSGPISVANYMKQVLTHPTKGYYTTRDVFGKEGDFTTSPETSHLFGELIGLWIMSECEKFHNKPFGIVELGPGRGSLASDILRVINDLGKSNQISLHLVEVSPVLAEIQRARLCSIDQEKIVKKEESNKNKHYDEGKSPDGVEVFWYKSILDIPEGFNVFIAQEFFDALPIHKFQKTKDGWFEMLVDIDPTSEKEKFRFVLSKTNACDTILNKNDPRDHVEISPEAINTMKYISTAITENGGFSLFVDYGHDGDKTDTFRAFRQHKQCHPLEEPGTADLTADVDFALLKRVAQESKKLLCFGPVTQREFLEELGIYSRLDMLCANLKLDERKVLKLGCKKLVDIHEMGQCFKVISMFPHVLEKHLKKYPVQGFWSGYTSKLEDE